MSIFTKIFKPSFYLSDNSKGLPLEESIRMMKDLKEMMETAPEATANNQTSKRSAKQTGKTYIRGINDKCLQFELLFEIEIDDTTDTNLEDSANLADYYVSLVNENFSYNVIKNKIDKTEPYNNEGKVKCHVGEKEYVFSTSALKMNGNKKYDKAFKDFAHVISTSDLIEKYRVYDDSDNTEIEISNTDFRNIEVMSEETEKIVIEKPKKMTDCKVVPIGPILKNDMRRKWIISFQPEIPDDLIFDDKTEFSAFIKDKSFFENNLVKNHEAFKIDDILICDLKYVVYHDDGSLFCKIKDVEVLDVKKHI